LRKFFKGGYWGVFLTPPSGVFFEKRGGVSPLIGKFLGKIFPGFFPREGPLKSPFWEFLKGVFFREGFF